MLGDDDDDKDIAISTPDDEPVTVTLDEPDEPVAKKADKPKEPDEREVAIADLKRQLDEQKAAAERERQARENAERFARDQAMIAKTSKVEVKDANLRVILNAIDATEQYATSAELTYADAMATGDYALAAKAQRAMANAESKLLQYQNAKMAMEEQQAPPQEGRVRDDMPEFRPQPRQSVTTVEDMASRLTPKSADWLRAHPQAAGNVNKLIAAHQAAVELKGLTPESDDYFGFIEGELGISQPKKEARQSSKASLASAPVNNGSSSPRSTGGDRANSMHLSADEVERAVLDEPSLPRKQALEIYARNKLALIREGKLSAN